MKKIIQPLFAVALTLSILSGSLMGAAKSNETADLPQKRKLCLFEEPNQEAFINYFSQMEMYLSNIPNKSIKSDYSQVFAMALGAALQKQPALVRGSNAAINSRIHTIAQFVENNDVTDKHILAFIERMKTAPIADTTGVFLSVLLFEVTGDNVFIENIMKGMCADERALYCGYEYLNRKFLAQAIQGLNDKKDVQEFVGVEDIEELINKQPNVPEFKDKVEMAKLVLKGAFPDNLYLTMKDIAKAKPDLDYMAKINTILEKGFSSKG